MIKIGKVEGSFANFGVVGGDGVEIDEVVLQNVEIGLWDGVLYPSFSTNQARNTTRAEWEAHLAREAAGKEEGAGDEGP